MNLHDFQQKMDQYLEEYCNQFIFSGSLRVTLKSEIIYKKCMGFADWERQLPITASTKFRLYSLSKPFCAIGILKLFDQGKVDLQTHPGQYLPEAKDLHPAVTIESMLHHTSGLPDFSSDLAGGVASSILIKELPSLCKQPQHFQPGTQTRYSNINYTLCAMIIEAVTGLSYAEYIKREVFDPLGMTDSFVCLDDSTLSDCAVGYDINANTIIPYSPTSSLVLGAGDIVSTVSDVFCLSQAIKRKLLLKAETWEQVLTPFIGSDYGLGCRIFQRNGKPVIMHNGGHSGFRTIHLQYPTEDLDIILLSNCGFGDSRSTITDAVYTLLYELDDIEESSIHGMDARYIRDVASSIHKKALLPERKISQPWPQEAEFLGEYENLELSKLDNYYQIRLHSGQRLNCIYVGQDLLSNTMIDEAYSISYTKDLVPIIMGSMKKHPCRSQF